MPAEFAKLPPQVLPAYAGMIPEWTSTRSPWNGAPRVCGDDPRMDVYPVSVERCSPRMRG